MVESTHQTAQHSQAHLGRLYELALTVAGNPIEVFDNIVRIIAELYGIRVALVEKLAPWETAAQYQMYHALALLAVGLLTARRCGLAINLAGTAMTLGTLLFSGCLYGWVLVGSLWLVRIVPIGGSLLIAGWVCLLVAVLRMGPPEPESTAAR